MAKRWLFIDDDKSNWNLFIVYNARTYGHLITHARHSQGTRSNNNAEREITHTRTTQSQERWKKAYRVSFVRIEVRVFSEKYVIDFLGHQFHLAFSMHIYIQIEFSLNCYSLSESLIFGRYIVARSPVSFQRLTHEICVWSFKVVAFLFSFARRPDLVVC